jgi:hypothetical protein
MDCPACGAATIAFPVESDLRAYLPGEAPGAAICTRCLALRPVTEPPAEPPAFEGLSDAFPTEPAAAVPTALALGLLSSLALHREEIAALLDRAERAGVDPMLLLGRLADDPGIEADFDLRRRRRQLEDLL